MYRKIRCDVRQWKILEIFRETKHSLSGFLMAFSWMVTRGFLIDGDTQIKVYKPIASGWTRLGIVVIYYRSLCNQ